MPTRLPCKRIPPVCAALLLLPSAATLCQQPTKPYGDATAVSVVQPGAAGHSTKVLTPSTTGLHLLAPIKADTDFMQGMIMHHGQAVEMTELVRTHTKNPKVLEVGRRIGVSQTSEMAFMKKWLRDRGFSTEMAPAPMADMSAMDMSSMDMSSMDMSSPGSMMMPGMLTPQQMTALRNANGADFDHLFLTGMIQHHTGALTMVKDLFAQPSAVQDPELFDFSSDVDNTQLAEIDMMKRLLKSEH